MLKAYYIASRLSMTVSLQLYVYLERQLFMNIRMIIAVALSSANKNSQKTL